MDKRPLNFLILEKDSFIARDMMEGLSFYEGSCRLHHFHSVDEMSQRLPATVDSLHHNIVVTKLSVAEIDASGLAQLADIHGCDMVVREGIDSAATVQARGWHSLAAPFSQHDLSILVSRMHA